MAFHFPLVSMRGQWRPENEVLEATLSTLTTRCKLKKVGQEKGCVKKARTVGEQTVSKISVGKQTVSNIVVGKRTVSNKAVGKQTVGNKAVSKGVGLSWRVWPQIFCLAKAKGNFYTQCVLLTVLI